MRVDPNTPYQGLPPLPPRVSVETTAVLKKAITANAALARLDAATRLLPDPAVLINTVPLLEAQASSEIENIVTTNDELFRAACNVDAAPSAATKEALRYRTALHAGFEMLRSRPLTAATARRVCSAIRGIDVDVRAGTGTHIGNPATRTWVYTPPVGRDHILSLLDNWEQFVHASDGIDPLVRLAVLHYQFEAIHPYSDGNGRTGRILNVLYLVEAGPLRFPVTYLSGYIVRHKDTYYSLLNGVTQDEAWEDWILFILEAVESTSLWTLTLIDSIREMQETTFAQIQRKFPRLPARDLAHLLYQRPYLRFGNVVDACGINRQTASRWLTDLEKAGIIRRTNVGRSAIFVNERFLDVLFNTPLPD